MGKMKRFLGCGSLALMLAADGAAFCTINHARENPSAMVQLQPFQTEVSRGTLAKASIAGVLVSSIGLLPFGFKRKETGVEAPQ